MSSIMDKLGNARRWAARAMANEGPIDARDEVLVDIIRAVEMLALHRQDKPADECDSPEQLRCEITIARQRAQIEELKAKHLQKKCDYKTASDVISDLHVALRSFALPTNPKALAAELSRRQKELEGLPDEPEKRASALEGHGALPTAQEILDAWSRVPGIIAEHRAGLVVEMVRARMMPELAARDKRIAELEKQVEDANAIHRRLDDLGIRTAQTTMRGEVKLLSLRDRVAELSERYSDATFDRHKLESRVAELESRCQFLEGHTTGVEAVCAQRLERIDTLEKRLSEATAALTVDGKTPGQVLLNAQSRCLEWNLLDSIEQQEYERRANAVLRAFGPVMVRGALERMREQINGIPTTFIHGTASFPELPQAMMDKFAAVVDTELARLEAPKPAPGHVHEPGPYSFCDKRPASNTTPAKPFVDSREVWSDEDDKVP